MSVTCCEVKRNVFPYKARILPAEFRKLTNMTIVAVSQTIKCMLNKKIILKEDGFYSVNNNYDQWMQKFRKNETNFRKTETKFRKTENSNIITFGKTGS